MSGEAFERNGGKSVAPAKLEFKKWPKAVVGGTPDRHSLGWRTARSRAPGRVGARPPGHDPRSDLVRGRQRRVGRQAHQRVKAGRGQRPTATQLVGSPHLWVPRAAPPLQFNGWELRSDGLAAAGALASREQQQCARASQSPPIHVAYHDKGRERLPAFRQRLSAFPARPLRPGTLLAGASDVKLTTARRGGWVRPGGNDVRETPKTAFPPLDPVVGYGS